jgi:flagellar capping protein FliD
MKSGDLMFTNQIRFGGLFSGMDTNNMVQQMMRAESMRLNRFTQRRQLVEWRQEHFRTTSDWLRDFQIQQLSIVNASRLGNLSSSDLINSSFNTLRTTVTGISSGSNANGLSVQAGINATPGQFKVTVVNPATAVTIRGESVSDGTLTGGIIYNIPSWTGIDFNFNFNLNGNNINISFRDGVNGVDLSNADNIKDTVVKEINRQLRIRFSPHLDPNDPDPALLDIQRVAVEIDDPPGNRLVFRSNHDDIRDVITLTAGTEIRTDAGSLVRACALSLLGFTSGANNTFNLNKTVVGNIPGFDAPHPGLTPRTHPITLPGTPTDWSSYTDAGGWRFHSLSTRPIPATYTVNANSTPPLVRQIMAFADTNRVPPVVEVVNMNFSTDPNSPPQWREVERDMHGVATLVIPAVPVTVTGPLQPVNNIVHEPRLHQSMTINGVSISIFPEDTVNDVINRINGSRAGVSITFDSHNRRFTMASTTTGVGSALTVNDPTNFLFRLGLGTYTADPIDTSASARSMGWLNPGPTGWPTPVTVLRSGDHNNPASVASITPRPPSWNNFGAWVYNDTTTSTPVRATITHTVGTNPPASFPVWTFDGVEFIQIRTGTATEPLTNADFLLVTRSAGGTVTFTDDPPENPTFTPTQLESLPDALEPVNNFNHLPEFRSSVTINGHTIEFLSSDSIDDIIDKINTVGRGLVSNGFEIIPSKVYERPFLVSYPPGSNNVVTITADPVDFLANMHNDRVSAREIGWLNPGRPTGWPETVTRNTAATPPSWAAFAMPGNTAGWTIVPGTPVPQQATFTYMNTPLDIRFFMHGTTAVEFVMLPGTSGLLPEHFLLVTRDEHGNARMAGTNPPNHPTTPQMAAVQASVNDPGTAFLRYNYIHTPVFESTMRINGLHDITIRHNYTVEEIIDRINAVGSSNGFGIVRNEEHGIPEFVPDTATFNDPTGFLQHIRSQLVKAEEHRERVDDADAKAAAQITFGQNAKITIDTGELEPHPVTGDPEPVIIIIDSETNRFSFRGHVITLNGAQEGTFTVDTTRDVSDAMDNIRAFVDSYNALILSINTMHTTARPRSNDRNFFEPLTQEQREAMSDREIERWEELAKTGLLHRDRTLRDIQNQLRQWITSGVTLQPGGETVFLHQLGITTGGGPHDLRLIGMLQIDEVRLQAALEENPERVMRLFTQPPPAGTATNTSQRNARLPQQGLNGRLNDIIANAISSTGSLFELAGTANTNSVTTRQMEEYDRRINDMHSWLARREMSLFAMFSRMEIAMARSQQQMESLWMFGNQ